MKNLIIIGAGGCGREVLQWVEDINEFYLKEHNCLRWKIKGFLDDNLHALDDKECKYEVINTVDNYFVEDNDEFICCIGNGKLRSKIIKNLKGRNACFTNVIHPSAIIADNCTIGEAVVIYPYALISDHSVLGNGCIINMYSSVAHDSILGNYCTISAHCDITGACHLGNNVFMGTTSNMVPKTTVGDNVYICAGSTVMSRLREGIKVIGNPAKKINF